MNSNEIITQKFDKLQVFFNKKDNFLYLNATQIAKKYNKKPADWLKTKEIKEYLEAICRKDNIPNGDLVVIRRGGNDKNAQGTWIHKKLIILFARWLSADFAVWCDTQIETLLTAPKISSTQKDRQIEDLRLHLRNKDREIIELKRAINRLTYNQSKGFSSGEQATLEVTSNNNLAYVSQLENQNKEFLNYIRILYKKIEDIRSFAFTVFNKSCPSFFEIDNTRLKQLVGAKA